MQISRLIKLLIWRLKRCTTLQFIISVCCQLDFPQEMNLQTQGQQMNWVKNAIKWGCQHQTLGTKRSQSSSINQLKNITTRVRKLHFSFSGTFEQWLVKNSLIFPKGTLLSTFLHCPLCIFADRSVLFFASHQQLVGQVVQGPWMPFASAGKKRWYMDLFCRCSSFLSSATSRTKLLGEIKLGIISSKVGKISSMRCISLEESLSNYPICRIPKICV